MLGSDSYPINLLAVWAFIARGWQASYLFIIYLEKGMKRGLSFFYLLQSMVIAHNWSYLALLTTLLIPFIISLLSKKSLTSLNKINGSWPTKRKDNGVHFIRIFIP